jgi:tetratricopeptide (TPR) repeat protein
MVRRCLLSLILLLIVVPVYAQDPIPSSARLNGLRFEYQTWCNCGPVNLTMALSYYGWTHDQTEAAGWLKPRVEDKNVSPDQLVGFVYHQTELPLGALWRYGGNLDVLKRLIAAGFPVIIESGFQPADEWMGHYMTLVAYDDTVETVWVYDSYDGLGADYLGIQHSYAQLDSDWRHFNRTFIVIYPLERESEVHRLLGPLDDIMSAASGALATAQQEIETNPADAWAWFNAGTSTTFIGRYTEAAAYYDEAIRLGLPFRMLWYQFGPYEAYYNAGRYYDVIRLANETEVITTEIEETNYWRGLAFAALGRTDDALSDLALAASLNPTFTRAAEAAALLESGAYVAPSPLYTLRPDIP